MPIYEFICDGCKFHFEMTCSHERIKDVFCPECKNKKVIRQWGDVGIQFKGPGFYSTDSKPKPIKQKEATKPSGSNKEKNVNKGKIKRG